LGSQAPLYTPEVKEGGLFAAKTAFLVYLNYPQLQFVALSQMESKQFAKVQTLVVTAHRGDHAEKAEFFGPFGKNAQLVAADGSKEPQDAVVDACDTPNVP